jgi:hypothetical protein
LAQIILLIFMNTVSVIIAAYKVGLYKFI